MIIENLRSYLKKCPLLKKDKINVNYLGDEPVAYSIETVPASPIVKRYTDGGTLRQYLFVFSSREAYDENALCNMNVAQFFEDFENWICEQDANKNYPDLKDDKIKVTRLEVTTGGYLFDEEGTTAKFQVQLKLTYRKER